MALRAATPHLASYLAQYPSAITKWFHGALRKKKGFKLADGITKRDALASPLFPGFSLPLSRLVELMSATPPHISR
jgi:hypothetical protein